MSLDNDGGAHWIAQLVNPYRVPVLTRQQKVAEIDREAQRRYDHVFGSFQLEHNALALTTSLQRAQDAAGDEKRRFTLNALAALGDPPPKEPTPPMPPKHGPTAPQPSQEPVTATLGAEQALTSVLGALTKRYAKTCASLGDTPTGAGQMQFLAENLVRTQLAKLGWKYGRRAAKIAETVTEFGVKDPAGKTHPCNSMHHAIDVVRQSTADGNDPHLRIVTRQVTDWEITTTQPTKNP